jgi:hypothetical protein
MGAVHSKHKGPDREIGLQQIFNREMRESRTGQSDPAWRNVENNLDGGRFHPCVGVADEFCQVFANDSLAVGDVLSASKPDHSATAIVWADGFEDRVRVLEQAAVHKGQTEIAAKCAEHGDVSVAMLLAQMAPFEVFGQAKT